MSSNNLLLKGEELKKQFVSQQGFLEQVRKAFLRWRTNEHEQFYAVDGVSISIESGEIVGLVGESGSGKTTLGRLLTRLTPPTDGKIVFDGEDITSLSRAKMRKHRQSIRMMFQKPGAALNPQLTIREILLEAIRQHPTQDIPEKEEKLRDLLEKVKLPMNVLTQYPNDLSGGLQRRVSIARTLVGTPKLIIADEPVAGLDVSIQAQIINLLKQINEEEGIAYLLISHNLKVVRYLSSRILVMYRGRIVEKGKADAISKDACHPYTINLLKSANYDLANIKSAVSEKKNDERNHGCPYRLDGCPIYESGEIDRDLCDEENPRLTDISSESGPHKVACHQRVWFKKNGTTDYTN